MLDGTDLKAMVDALMIQTAPVLDFVRDNRAWTAPIVAVLAFSESLAILSLLVPATVLLVGIGALIGAAGITLATAEFWTIWLAGSFGAVLGDWVSYEFGRCFDQRVRTLWPLNRRPDLVDRAELFIRRHGVWGVFLGRFFGPLRALVPIAAGIFDMPRGRFQLANVASALLWALALLAPGAGLLGWLAG
jgi:membrane protein DedA with SNARE-associated domain